MKLSMKTVLLFVLFASIPVIMAAIPKNEVFTATDHGMWEAQRNEALAIGYNLDSCLPGTRTTINTGANTDVDITNDIIAPYMLRSITINTDQWLTLVVSGTDINASNGNDTVTIYIPSGSTTLDFTNVTTINFANSSGSTATVYILPLTMKQKASM